VWGLREGVRRPLAVSNSRLRINSILNSVTRRGTFIGNSAGVMGACTLSPRPSFLIRLFPFKALVYNAINSSIDSMRGKHDTFGSMSAGALTGALYKSTGRKFSSQIISSLIAFVSWSQTNDCRCDYRVCSSRHLEYYKKECLIPLIQFIILSISSLLLSWHL